MGRTDPKALEQLRETIPPALLDELVDAENRRRKAGGASYREITSGEVKRRARPQASVEDRAYVPGALRQWRLVHGLSAREAAARVGLAPSGASWKHYEDGFQAPSYRTLLAIIAATGMDPAASFRDPASGADPNLRLDALRADHDARVRSRRAKRLAES